MKFSPPEVIVTEQNAEWFAQAPLQDIRRTFTVSSSRASAIRQLARNKVRRIYQKGTM